MFSFLVKITLDLKPFFNIYSLTFFFHPLAVFGSEFLKTFLHSCMTKPTVENHMMHLQKNPWHTSKIHKQEMSLGKNHLSPLYSLVHLSPASLIFWNTLMWVWKACRKSHKLSSVCQGAGAECAWGKARTVSAKECSQQHSPIPMLTLSVSPSYRSDDSLYIFILFYAQWRRKLPHWCARSEVEIMLFGQIKAELLSGLILLVMCTQK